MVLRLRITALNEATTCGEKKSGKAPATITNNKAVTLTGHELLSLRRGDDTKEEFVVRRRVNV